MINCMYFMFNIHDHLTVATTNMCNYNYVSAKALFRFDYPLCFKEAIISYMTLPPVYPSQRCFPLLELALKILLQGLK